MSKILLVEDNRDIQKLIEATLRAHRLSIAATLADAAAELRKTSFDLAILDVSLPDGSGFEFLSQLHLDQKADLPVIFLTAKSGIEDKVFGFSLGAEDYITKPFNPIEFRARVEARLRKREEQKSQKDFFSKGDLQFELGAQRVIRKDSLTSAEEVLILTPLEFKLLLHLARHEEQVLSRDQLLSSVWGNETHVFDRTVDTHVSHLRRKLRGSICSIEPVYGSGYRFKILNEGANLGASDSSALEAPRDSKSPT